MRCNKWKSYSRSELLVQCGNCFGMWCAACSGLCSEKVEQLAALNDENIFWRCVDCFECSVSLSAVLTAFKDLNAKFDALSLSISSTLKPVSDSSNKPSTAVKSKASQKVIARADKEAVSTVLSVQPSLPVTATAPTADEVEPAASTHNSVPHQWHQVRRRNKALPHKIYGTLTSNLSNIALSC